MNSRPWHPGLIKAVVQCLQNIFVEKFYADKVLQRAFRENKQWGAKDRKFIAETVYDMVRWWGFLSSVDGGELFPKDPKVYVSRWSVYEAWKHEADVSEFLEEKIPDFAKIPRPYREIATRLNNYVPTPWEKLSFPQWIFDKFEKQFGPKASRVLEKLNEPARVYMRVNSLKIEPMKLLKLLEAEEAQVSSVPDIENCLVLKERKNIFITKAFREGFFEVQDLASQRIAPLLDVKPGERVADVCAGAGGKTLHLAALMKNKGSLLAADVTQKKLNELKVRSVRAGVSNLRIQLFENSKDTKRHHQKFDAVLIDAPCSGSGVFRRNPDSKWKMSVEELERLKLLQIKVLDDYSKFVRSGGRMVYATCSVWSDENEDQITAFLQRNPQFSKEEPALVTRPDLADEDGFFAQKLVRK